MTFWCSSWSSSVRLLCRSCIIPICPPRYMPRMQKSVRLFLAPSLRSIDHSQSDWTLNYVFTKHKPKIRWNKPGPLYVLWIPINTWDPTTRSLQPDTRGKAPCLEMETETQNVCPRKIQSHRCSSVIQIQHKAISHASNWRQTKQ